MHRERLSCLDWLVLPSRRRSALAWLIAGVLASTSVQAEMTFVTVLKDKPFEYRPPFDVTPATRLAVLLPALLPADAVLHVDLMVDHDGDGLYGFSEVGELMRLSREQIVAQDLDPAPAQVAVLLGQIDRPGVAEVQARLVHSDGSTLAPACFLTLDSRRAVEQAPSLIRRALTLGTSALQWLADVSLVVRSSDTALHIYTADVQAGGDLSGNRRKLTAAPADIRAVTIARDGASIAWIVHSEGRWRLWRSAVEPFAPALAMDADRELRSPRFLAGDELAVVRGEELVRVAPAGASVIPLTPRKVVDLYEAREAGGKVEFILAAQEPGDSTPLPYLARFASAGEPEGLFRLPLHPYYDSYPLLLGEAGFFSTLGGEGGGALQFRALEAGAPRTVLSIRDPGPLAVAAAAGRLVFTASAVEVGEETAP